MPYFEKNFLLAMAVLGYLAKLKSGLGLTFDTHFLHDFSRGKFLFNSLSMDKVSMSHLISFSRYQLNLCNLILLQAFTVYMENSLWFEISLRSI